MERMDSRLETVNDIILKTIDKYKEEDLLDSYKILQRLFQNLSENIYEQKYKTFKKTNPTLSTKVLKISEVLEILQTLGYKELDKDTLIYAENDFNYITQLSEDLKMFINIIESKLTNRKLLELAEKDPEKKAFLEEQKKREMLKKEEENRLKDILETHKQEVKNNWNKNIDSVAKDVKFGSTECKFEPKFRGG